MGDTVKIVMFLNNDPASHLEELGGVLLDGPEEPEALLLVVHDGPTGHTERGGGRANPFPVSSEWD